MLGDRDYMRNEWSNQHHVPRSRETSAVKILIIINTVIFVLQYMTSGIPTQYTQGMHYSQGGITSYLWLSVERLPEFWRFITYMFVHGGFMHIFFNMWALYLFGKPVEERIGSFVFMKLYFLSGIIGALSWLIFNLDSKSPVIGASSAVFGVMAAAALLLPDMKILLLFPPVVMKVKTLVICLSIIEIVMLNQLHSGIAHLAHLGGLLGGFIFIKKYLTRDYQSKHHVSGFNSFLRRLKQQSSNLFGGSTTHSPDLRFVRDEDDDELLNEDTINAKIDPILDKIGKSGMKSLTIKERRLLDKAREKLKRDT